MGALILFIIGGLLIITGIILLVKRKENNELNKIKFFGAEMETRNSALIVFIIGAAMIVIGAGKDTGNKNGTEASATGNHNHELPENKPIRSGDTLSNRPAGGDNGIPETIVINREPGSTALKMEVRDAYVIISRHLPQRYETMEGSRKQKVAAYVNYIADQAGEIAGIWETVVQAFRSGAISRNKEEMANTLKTTYNLTAAPNEPYYSSLITFYSIFPREELGANSWVDNISNALTELVAARELSVSNLDALVRDLEDPRFFYKTRASDRIRDLSESVDLVKKEAAALRSLAAAINILNV